MYQLPMPANVFNCSKRYRKEHRNIIFGFSLSLVDATYVAYLIAVVHHFFVAVVRLIINKDYSFAYWM